jgi:hypothetical protein
MFFYVFWQDADESLDPSLMKPVWYCTSSRGHTTVAKYAEYQAGTLEEACIGDESARRFK